MDTVIFKNGTAFCQRERAHRDDSEIEYPIDSLSSYLNCDVVLEEGTTLRHVWQYLDKDTDFFDLVFCQALGHYPLKIYLEQARRSSSPDTRDGMTHLIAYWSTEKWEKEIDFSPCFGGKGTLDGQECGFAVEFTPINDLLDYPFILDDTAKIVDGKRGFKTIVEGKHKWTVYDMLFAILFEISFVGTPNDQLRMISDLDQRLAEAKENIELEDENADDSI